MEFVRYCYFCNSRAVDVVDGFWLCQKCFAITERKKTIEMERLAKMQSKLDKFLGD